MIFSSSPGGHEHEGKAVDELHPSQGVHPHVHQHSIQHRHWDEPVSVREDDHGGDCKYDDFDILENGSKLCGESDKEEYTDASDSLKKKNK